MSAKSSDATVSAPHPRETMALFGHHDAEQALLSAYRSGRIAHAWLMSGAQGIGKATLAYRMARFVLAHPDPLSAPVQAAATLGIDPSHPVARQVASGAHGGLLTLERTVTEKGVMPTFIAVGEVRKTV
ncbi:MAG: DNA polymerase III subunit delta', partial [Tardiphaga sp.]|nr:DNA polymerase III subunit delta' [Tardiphaga sp.]